MEDRDRQSLSSILDLLSSILGFIIHTGTPGIPNLTRYTELRVVIKSVLQSESPQLKLVAWPGILSRPRRFPLGSIT